MAVLVGIDEAGFGPILGPLVVSSTVFSIPRDYLESDLWHLLKRSVANSQKRLAGRLLVTDSKKAYSRKKGIKQLQRTVLSALSCLGEKPAALTDLVSVLCSECTNRLTNYPWYQTLEDYELSADKADIEIASQVFANDLNSNDIRLLKIESRCLDVAHYNQMVSVVKNKATVLFTAASSLIKSAWDNFGNDDLQVIIDRQGGRVHYRKILQRSFEDMELKILKETPAASSYQLNAGGKQMRLHFVVGADSRFFPVSLASMVSKYLRELLVYNINRYFAAHCANLKPTAGYWKDGLRFIEDLKKNIPHVQYDSNQLIRSR